MSIHSHLAIRIRAIRLFRILGSVQVRVGQSYHLRPVDLAPPLGRRADVAPTIGLRDTGILLDAMVRNHLSTHVNNHPLTVFLGHLFIDHLPFDNIA